MLTSSFVDVIFSKHKLYHFLIKDDIEAAVKLELQLHSKLEFVS
jgi:hypothetical protein